MWLGEAMPGVVGNGELYDGYRFRAHNEKFSCKKAERRVRLLRNGWKWGDDN